MFNKNQIITIGCFLGLFMILYFGCSTKSKEHKALEKSRAQKFELINIDRIINEAQDVLPATARNQLAQFNQQLKLIETDSQKVTVYKEMASLWYANQNPLISGHFAEKIAEITNEEKAWSITGTTYSIAVQRLKESNERKHAVSKSRAAFEKAISIDPAVVDNKINLAISYVDAPLEDNPMKGILMLRDLNREDPENISVLMHLGRLSIRTGQFQKAVERLTKVIDLRPKLAEAHCMLAESYVRLENMAKAKVHQEICNKN